jgi:predicted nucleotidyltransferase
MTNISHNWLNNLQTLNLFTKDYSKKIHASKIARDLKLPQRTVSRKLNELNKLNLINYTHDGNNKLFYFDLKNKNHLDLLTLVEQIKSINFKLNYPKISIALNELNSVSNIILFGSYAKGIPTPESDIDLVVITNQQKECKKIIKKYPFNFSLHFISQNELQKSLKTTLGIEIIKNHIFLSNIEKYTKLFIKWTK